MSYLTKEEYVAAIGGYSFIEKAVQELAETYRKKFVGGRYATLTDTDIDCDSIDGEIELEFEVNYCGCCPGDYETYTVPVEYLWDDSWITKEEQRRDEECRIAEEKKALAKAQKEKERAEQRYEEYLRLKEEYEE